jgi:tetratricopeptide (TPR) repeat protein
MMPNFSSVLDYFVHLTGGSKLQTNRGLAMAFIFGLIGMGIAYLIVGKVGWQTGLGFGLGGVIGRALSGDLDSQPQNSQHTQLAQPTIQHAGTQTGLNKQDEAILFNDQAFVLDLQGNRNAAMDLWAKAALAGVANALASFTWNSLRDGKYQDAIELHNECFPKLHIGNDAYQLANCLSNYGLNLLASTGDIKKSQAIWIENFNSNHPESKFYAVLAAHIQGDIAERDKYAKRLNSTDWSEVRSTLFEEKLTAKGWFKEWSNKGIELIDEIGPSR